MRWEKKGLIYKPQGIHHWNKIYGILPTPFMINDSCIRIYFASTDDNRFGRISFIDVLSSNPSKIVTPAVDPVLEPGISGTFDDCGCNPSCLVEVGQQRFLYYSGFQRSYKIPYSIFTGLAISVDMGRTFKRFSLTPILERTEAELTIRSAPTVIFLNGMYLMWYVSALRWELMENGIFKNRMMPRYIIKRAVSDDGIHWSADETPCIHYENEFEFGFGRPWVIFDEIYKMWYSIRRVDKSYRIGYAESTDGVTWIRKDSEVGIDVSPTGWDSEMICYPAVIKVKDRTYLFYNGNNNGETGFGWAELIEP